MVPSTRNAGRDDGDFTAKALFGVIAVAGAFLAVGCHTVPDQFMGNTPVTDKLDGDVEVLQHGLMGPA